MCQNKEEFDLKVELIHTQKHLIEAQRLIIEFQKEEIKKIKYMAENPLFVNNGSEKIDHVDKSHLSLTNNKEFKTPDIPEFAKKEIEKSDERSKEIISDEIPFERIEPSESEKREEKLREIERKREPFLSWTEEDKIKFMLAGIPDNKY